MLALLVCAVSISGPSDWFDVTKSKLAIFNLRDVSGRKMDCLKLVASANGRKFYGVYHAMKDDVFHLWLAESRDAKNWKPIREIDAHGHQGTITISGKGQVLVAWEKDVPGQGNHIHLAYYKTENDLERGSAEKEKDIDRTYSPSAEGTPSFETVDWKSNLPDIVLGFHYWRNSDVDRQAVGTLDSKWNWTCQKRPAYDQFVESFGVKGNIGDRESFRVKDDFTILEGMTTKGDWSSWRLYLVDCTKNTCNKILVKTPKGSTSFANPNITVVRNTMYVTLFMPSQGNDLSESGELLYAINLR